MQSSERDPLNIVGQTIAEKYVIERLVGEGGFALVYRAEHNIWKKPVAIKFFSALSSAPEADRAALHRTFVQEGALLTELSSQTAGIVQARDIGTFTSPDGRWMPFMVLEWLYGRSLETVLEEEPRRRSLDETLRVLKPAARALDVAHGRGIAHRDIKPANIFVLGAPAPGGAAPIKILDFGVAKLITDSTEMQAALARTGASITSFTPQYGAPEQFSRTHGATGPWTDVFALALVAVEMLRGRPALEGDDLVQLAVCSAHTERRPTPRALGVAVSDAVESVFQRALSVEPQQRYPHAGAFIDALVAAHSVGRSDALASTAFAATAIASSGPASRGLAVESSRYPDVATASTLKKTAAGAPPARAPSKRLGLSALAVVAVAAVAGFVMMRGSTQGPRESDQGPQPSARSLGAVPLAQSAARQGACPSEMVEISAGEFYMGSDLEDAKKDAKPAHHVKLAGFCIDRSEVTRADYLRCSKTGRCPRAGREANWPGITKGERAAYTPLCNGEAADRDRHPINCVTWQNAEVYCRRNGKRLPTEAEWEYATRGPDGRVYPWGDDEPTARHLNACDRDCSRWAAEAKVPVMVLFEHESDGYAATAPVGSFPAGSSRFGPVDVVGNVWEWVFDRHGPYTSEDAVNPTGPEAGGKRVIRGGGWNGGHHSWLRPSFRYASDPDVRSPAIGFRCARSLESTGENAAAPR
jgi:formylglycine-generating enzyme required for sulfatase activity